MIQWIYEAESLHSTRALNHLNFKLSFANKHYTEKIHRVGDFVSIQVVNDTKIREIRLKSTLFACSLSLNSTYDSRVTWEIGFPLTRTSLFLLVAVEKSQRYNSTNCVRFIFGAVCVHHATISCTSFSPKRAWWTNWFWWMKNAIPNWQKVYHKKRIK